MEVWKLSPEAEKLAGMYFFETVVRIHRAGEGLACTGLKPAEAQSDPGIVATDKALEKRSIEEVFRDLTEKVHHGVHEQFTNTTAEKSLKNRDVAAGCGYVNPYVQSIHYVKRLYQPAEQLRRDITTNQNLVSATKFTSDR